MKQNVLKRAFAAGLAVLCIAACAPANIGSAGLLGGAAITAYAAGEDITSNITITVSGSCNDAEHTVSSDDEDEYTVKEGVVVTFACKKWFNDAVTIYLNGTAVATWSGYDYNSKYVWTAKKDAKINWTEYSQSSANIYLTETSTVDVTGVTLNKESTTLTVGAEETLTATVAPEGATNKNVTWSSSNTDVATVDANGKVTAVAAGKANITASATNGTANDTSDDRAATCEVTVIDPNLPDGKYAQGAVVDNVNYTRFVYVLPLSELDGKNKATFTVTKGDASATFDTSYYYTGMVSSGVTYKPANNGSVMLICNVKGGAPTELTCSLSIDGEVYEPNN